MSEDRTLRAGSFRVTVVEPTDVVDVAGDARDVFEAVWQRLPPFVEDNSFCALPGDGCFLKGQRMRPHARLEAVRQARRLVREVAFLRRMRAAGVPVPKLLAWGVETKFGCSLRSFLLLRLLSDAEDLRAIIRRTTAAERGDLWRPVGAVVAQLHATRLFHRDLTARNLMVQRREGAVRVHLIDCPRAEYGRLAPRRAFLRRSDLFRLGRSVLKAGGEPDEVRLLLRHVGAEHADQMLAAIVGSAGHGRRRPLRTSLWIAFGV